MTAYGLIAAILIIGVICTLLSIPEKFQRLLYVIAVVLVIVLILQLFGFNFPGNFSIR